MSARSRAFFWHLSASLVVGLLALILVFFIWYPSPLHEAVGVTHIFLLLLGVHIILGPLLTLLVYKVGKKTLVFDMVVIVLLQLGALSYGLAIVAEGRPVWLVFSADRFDLVRALDIDVRKIDDALPEYRQEGWFGPQWVGAMAPDTPEKRNAIMFEALEGGSDLAQRPNLYVPLNSMSADLVKRARPLDELNQFNPVASVTQVIGQWPAADAWLPLMASGKAMTVLLRKETGELVAVVDLQPWAE
jgi:hypothetical protein